MKNLKYRLSSVFAMAALTATLATSAFSADQPATNAPAIKGPPAAPLVVSPSTNAPATNAPSVTNTDPAPPPDLMQLLNSLQPPAPPPLTKADTVNRIVRLKGEITQDMANDINQQLIALDQLDPTAPIELQIDSPGGSVDAGFSIIKTMDFIHCPVKTVCEGMAASMAAEVLVNGTPGMRTAKPYSLILIHGLSLHTDVGGKMAQIDTDLQPVRIEQEYMIDVLVKGTHQPREKIENMLRYADNWMSTAEALKFGMIDSIEQAPVKQAPSAPSIWNMLMP